MSSEPHGHTIFCDDIRTEVGNKFSLMGVIQGGMLVHTSFPATLPRLGFFISYTEPLTIPPSPVKLLIYFPGDEESKPTFVIPVEWPPDAADATPDEEATIRQINMHFVMSPVVIKETGAIKVRMDRQGTIIKIGAMKILQGESPSMSPGPST